MLPGMFPGATSSGVTFIGVALSTAATITIPSAALVGDVAVLFDYAQQAGSIPSSVTPTGWTSLAESTEVAGSDSRCVVSYRILTTGQPGSSVTGMNAADDDNKIMLVFRAVEAVSTVTPSTWDIEMGPGAPSNQTISASGQSTPLVALAGVGSAELGNAAFGTQTPTFAGTEATADGDFIVGYTIYDSAPANHTVGQSDLGNSNCLVSGYLIFS